MTEPEDIDEDLFADLYDGDDTAVKPVPQVPDPIPPTAPAPVQSLENSVTPIQSESNAATKSSEHPKDVRPESPLRKEAVESPNDDDQRVYSGNHHADSPVEWDDNRNQEYSELAVEHEIQGIGIKEDGKMFIGGLNWETTDQTLKKYFSQFGEVLECTVMRDGASGRSRGFGFLTFKDAKTVNIVMVKEHYLDGKIIDPKRAIPRDEQERTSKIFVGGVSQDATETDFKEFFMQFGRVIDATLMIDKDTGRPRGFGFVTFDSEAAVDATLERPLEILGKPIEVKKAQPRGNIREEDDRGSDRKFTRRGGPRDGNERYERDRDIGRQATNFEGNNSNNSQNQNLGQSNNNNSQSQNMANAAMTPQMMAQYWQRMQLYFAMMQERINQGNAIGGGVAASAMAGMAGMNPAILQQMQAMSAMQSQGTEGSSQGPPTANSQAMQGMNAAMIQQIQQQMQVQQQQQQQQAQAQAQSQAQAQAQAQAQLQAQVQAQQQAQAQAQQQAQAQAQAQQQAQQQAQLLAQQQAQAQANAHAQAQAQLQAQQMQAQSAGYNGNMGANIPGNSLGGGNQGGGYGGGIASTSGPSNAPGYNAYEQQLFEQQKYEQQQQARRMPREQQQQQQPYPQQPPYQNGPTSWEGMYDDVPQPHIPIGPSSTTRAMHQGGYGRQVSPAVGPSGPAGANGGGGHRMGSQTVHRGPSGGVPPTGPSSAPANAPTGPKNAGKPGANYRGGGRGGGHRGYHPYSR
ncbi:MAG: hypothetical protein M1829_004967 [Trizodia sp. TS-e1964]|nr:MAG: hypothetical protein M1829_004967 [Trizodia sp. TS-e1964]